MPSFLASKQPKQLQHDNIIHSRHGSSIKTLLFFLPLTILALELLLWPFFLTASSSQSSSEPTIQRIESTSASSQPSQIIPLSELTTRGSSASYSRSQQQYACPEGLVYIPNSIRSKTRLTKNNRTAAANNIAIPKIIHQTSKSRCVTPSFAKTIHSWQSFGAAQDDDSDYYSHYLHDDEAVQRLLYHELGQQGDAWTRGILDHCLVHGTLRADLWRYVVLYVYGGIYADLDSVPTPNQQQQQQLSTMLLWQNNSGGVFVLEQYHMLSQYFMALPPRHPLMWYAIYVSLQALSLMSDTGSASAAMVTGPHALHKALREFCKDAGRFIGVAGVGRKPVQAGMYKGTSNYTITVYGNASHQNEFVQRDAFAAVEKRESYQQMGMRHFTEDKQYATGQSCLSAMLKGSNKRLLQ